MRNIYIFDAINKELAENVIKSLLEFSRKSSDDITLLINSNGGSVSCMFSIIETMNMVKPKIRTIVMNTAASAAAIIAASGDERLIAKNAKIMVHEVSCGTYGKISEIEKDVNTIRTENDKMFAILAKKTGKSVDELKKKIGGSDKYFDPDEAVKFGLVDRKLEKKEFDALKLSEPIYSEGFEIKSDVKEIQILRTGDFEHPVYGEIKITGDVLEKMVENFNNNVRGIDISIDYTHDNENGESPAAFWIKSLEIRDKDNGKALFALGEYTETGLNKIRENEYKYSSADFCMDYVDESGKHHPYVLRGGTLTNRPFIKNMSSIKLSEKNKEKGMTKEEMLASLKNAYNIDFEAVSGEKEVLAKRVDELQNKLESLSKLPAEKDAEIAKLKESLVAASSEITAVKKEGVFENLVAQGKVLPAQKDKVMRAFKDNVELEDFYKDAPVIVNMKTKGSSAHNDNGLTETEAALVAQGVVKEEDIIKFRKPAIN